MLGQIVTLIEDGRRYLVKRDGLRDDGTRRLRLKPLDGGTLRYVEPAAVQVDLGRTTESEAHDEAQGEAEGDD